MAKFSTGTASFVDTNLLRMLRLLRICTVPTLAVPVAKLAPGVVDTNLQCMLIVSYAYVLYYYDCLRAGQRRAVTL